MSAARANATRLTSTLSSIFTTTNQTLKPLQTHITKPLIISLLKSSTHKSHLLQIHAHILHSSLLFDSAVCLHFLSQTLTLTLTYPRRFLAHIPNPKPIHYNTLIRAHSATPSSPHLGIILYNEARRFGIRLNSISCFFAIQCCIQMESLQVGAQIYARSVRDGHGADARLLTSVMTLFSNCGKYLDARKVFDEITEKDRVAWNTLLSCCLRNGHSGHALDVFDAMMINGGCEPDDVSCLLTLQACGNMNALEFGERVHGYVEERRYDNGLKVCNALITMYSRCGCVEKAYEVFKGMRSQSVVTWSAMINGLAVNGFGRDAVEAFCEMRRAGVLPDAQVFTGVLNACSHCGLVDEGMDIFERMSKEFGVVPNIHHYGCVVDLLSRAGRLDQAYELITLMDGKPDSKIWRTLLGACRIHNYEMLGERLVDHLVEIKAQEAGDYVLLMNIYSTAKNWEKVAELRKFMKENAVQTTPGCSTVILNGTVHEFLVDDVSHPRKEEIYRMLDEINSQLKIAGYVADDSSELHNFGAEEKGYALSYHSEKLAIAFGVLETPPGTTIRVAKNLRTCIDCHNFAMILSGVYNRTIIVRDRSRFHHFREGRCSCNGYW